MPTAAETMQYHTVDIIDGTFKHRVGQMEIGINLDSSKQPINLCLSAVGKNRIRRPDWEAEKAVGQAFCKDGAAGISAAFEIVKGTKVSTSSLLIFLLFVDRTDFPAAVVPAIEYHADPLLRPIIRQPS